MSNPHKNLAREDSLVTTLSEKVKPSARIPISTKCQNPDWRLGLADPNLLFLSTACYLHFSCFCLSNFVILTYTIQGKAESPTGSLLPVARSLGTMKKYIQVERYSQRKQLLILSSTLAFHSQIF